MAMKRNKPSWNKLTPSAELKYEGNANKGGIYQITNKLNDRKYVGSTCEFKSRWYTHLRELRKNKHYNKFLQNDFNKHGEENYIFEILEIVDGTTEERQAREQYFLDQLFANTPKDDIFNHSEKAVITENKKKPKERVYRKDWYWFLGPDHKTEYVVENLSAFCKEYELNRPAMNNLALEKIEQYKGWTYLSDGPGENVVLVNKKTKEEIKLIDSAIGEFAKEHDLFQSHLIKLLAGKRQSCGDWFVKDRVVVPRPCRGKGYRLISPEGKVVKFNNLQKFARENNLGVSGLEALIRGFSYRGKRKKYQSLLYKGWLRYGTDHEMIAEKKKESYQKRFQKSFNNMLFRDPAGRFVSSLPYVPNECLPQ